MDAKSRTMTTGNQLVLPGLRTGGVSFWAGALLVLVANLTDMREAGLCVGVILLQWRRRMTKQHLAGEVLKIGIHCQRQSHFVSEECLCWHLQQHPSSFRACDIMLFCVMKGMHFMTKSCCSPRQYPLHPEPVVHTEHKPDLRSSNAPSIGTNSVRLVLIWSNVHMPS